MIDRETIKRIALEAGFGEWTTRNGKTDVNHLVYIFADRLVAELASEPVAYRYRYGDVWMFDTPRWQGQDPDEVRPVFDRPHPSIPPGWKLVPEEPTREMMESVPAIQAINAVRDLPLLHANWSIKAIMNRKTYLAMLAAAPEAPK